ncbi:MAG: SpoIIE family protein phosphatase [Solirubrobacteraceae bacterium]
MTSAERDQGDSRAGILLVDDVPENLVALQAVLEPLGERLVCVESGDQALRALLHEEVAVILLDVRMAGMDGLETARIVRSRPRTRHIPIIFLTAEASDVEQISLAYATGAVDYVIKPFAPDVLRAKVSVFVELSRERAERVRQSRARAQAEAVAATVRKLQIVSDAALAHLELDDLVTEILERATTLFDADAAGLLLRDDDGRGVSLHTSHGEPLPLPDGQRVGFGEGALGQLADERRPSLLSAAELAPAGAAQSAIDSYLVVPLLGTAGLVGLLYLGARPGRQFGDGDLDLLAFAGERVALAIEHAQRFAHGLELVEVLQRGLLPEGLPAHPRLQLAARYRPSGFAARVGGDWYDALLLDDERIGVMIGDVVGHGLRAATTMGELRSALRAFAIEGHSPSEALRCLDRVVHTTHGPGMLATVLFLILDTGTETVTLASAGHLPPAVVSPDGHVRLLETTPFPPLGVDDHGTATEHVYPFAAGDTLLLYTDGLVERRGESIDHGLERLRGVLRDAPAEIEALCDRILTGTLGDHPAQDDVAVVTVRLLEQSAGRLALTLPATADSVPVARHRLRSWLGVAAPELTLDAARDLEMAWGEACTNAVRHAYGPGDATFSLRMERVGSEIVLEVADHGSWRESRGDQGGWGLKLMRAVCDGVEVDREPGGTRVRLRQTVRPATATASAAPPRAGAS